MTGQPHQMTGPLASREGRKTDAELKTTIGGQVVIAIGVPQGLNIREDEPETRRQFLVRRGEDFVPLLADAWSVWRSALTPRSPTELSALAAGQLGQPAADELLTSLHRAGLLASFDRDASWLLWSKRLRALPMAIGLGNSPDNPTLYSIRGLHSDQAVLVDALSYWNWLAWDGTTPIFDRAQEVAKQLDVSSEIILEHARGVLLVCLNAGFLLVDCVPLAASASNRQP